jgi:hypothetical protein
MNTNKKILRPGDLAAKGVRSTIRGNYGFAETFQHIFMEANKPDPEWKNYQKR